MNEVRSVPLLDHKKAQKAHKTQLCFMCPIVAGLRLNALSGVGARPGLLPE